MTVSAFIDYRTRAGDTFDELALQVYVIIFEESVPLKIPIFDETETPETLAPWRRGA